MPLFDWLRNWRRNRASQARSAAEEALKAQERWVERLTREAKQRIAEHGPPEAPWKRFPKLPNCYSLGWRMGVSETYLNVEFFPWWRTQTPSECRAYLADNDAPDDWREYLAALDGRRTANKRDGS